MKKIVAILIVIALAFQVIAVQADPSTTPKVWFPLISRQGLNTTTLSGQILDTSGKPAAGVAVVDQDGRTAYTGADGRYVLTNEPLGYYSLAPSANKLVFSPAVVNGQAAGEVAGLDFLAVPPCGDAFTNRGFEHDNPDSWEIPVTTYSARYSTDQAHTELRSMQTGIVKSADNIYSYSSARQLVELPSSSASATLRMWVYPISTEVLETAKALPPVPQEGRAFSEAVLASDVQYVVVLDQNDIVLKTLYWARKDNQVWRLLEFNLNAYLGDKIQIEFGTYNDGWDGVTAMYVDDASLEYCPESGVTPTPTPVPGPTATPVPTPIPGACPELVLNGGFETKAEWIIPITEFSAGYSDEQAHTGVRSMRNGIVHASHNRFSYSDAGQEVTIPKGISSATLSFWVYSRSTEVIESFVPEIPATMVLGAEALTGGDIQYALILDEFGNWIDTALWRHSNARSWQQFSFNLTGYKGDTIRVQFGTFNDGLGGVTVQYVDDVSVQACP
jgi:hypothetical protein